MTPLSERESREATPAASRIRVLCVDDHALVRDGLIAMLSREPDIEVVASAGTGEEAVGLFQQHHPDVTIMDLRLPGTSGLEALVAMRSADPRARVIVLTMHRGEEDIYRAFKAGAAAYVMKHAVFDELVEVIRRVHTCDCPIPPAIAAALARRAGSPQLTSREVEVLEFAGRGLRNKEIAQLLGITEETVKAHMKHLFAKLEVTDRTEAWRVALQRGILRMIDFEE